MNCQLSTVNPFYTDFSYTTAIPYEAGVTRRDPSPVIRVNDTYHVWYTKAYVDDTGYFGSVWYATSPDGHRWTEHHEAIATGPNGSWDANGVFTPTILVADKQYYLFYTAVPKPFDSDNGGPNSTPTAIGTAYADSPDGPWMKYDENPVLKPGTGREPDSHRLDDACLIVRNHQYWLYYKGRQKGLTPAETKMCLALAGRPAGPYTKYENNPILPSGHEVCVWPHGNGVVALISPCGPEANTVQYSEDGIHFTRMAIVAPPRAPGPYRADNYRDGAGPGITWGLCHDIHSEDRPFLLRFACTLTSTP